jgi:hypothetical protein
MKDTSTHFAWTRYGFEYGAARVERACSGKGYVVLRIETPRQIVDITVTPTGLIRLGELAKIDRTIPT